LLVLILLYAILGIAVISAGSRLGRRGLALGIVAPVATLIWLAIRLPDLLDGETIEESLTWIPQLGLDLDVRVDGFSALMVLIVAGIGVLVFAYAARYLPREGAGVGRLVGLLTLFAGAMVGLVVSDNLFFLYTFWELTSVTSYLLIGNDHADARARASALQALLITSAGGLAMLVGFVLLGQSAGTYRLSEIVASPPSGTTVTVALVLVLLGAMTKSAQYPFHAWLPGAMVAPTPISAYLHSATMVTAGVYLVARLSPAFASEELWRPTVFTVGLVTMLAGGLRALRQHDLKLLLAFGTVSQLGFMFLVMGAGTAEAATGGSLLLLAHAIYKAALFMVVGIIDHETGTRDMRALPGFGRRWRPVVVIGVVTAASMAGVPLAFGFVAKEADFEVFAGNPFGGAWVVLAGVTVGSVLTVAYSIRFVWGAFTAGATDWANAPPAVDTSHSPSASFVAPAAVLAVCTLLLGVVPAIADGLISAATKALDATAGSVDLAVWHGVNLALVLSAVALVGGAALFVARRPVARVLAAGRRIPSGADIYLLGLRGLNVVADRVTAVVQTGSLPFYGAVILLTAAIAPGVALLTSSAWAGWPEVLDTPAHLPIAALIVGGALGAALVRRRLGAVVFLSVVGYGMTGLFVIEGAPDLALTQVTVETLSTVLFVLVLRRLPPEFGPVRAIGRPLRIAVAAGVGAMVFAFALIASGNRSAPAVSQQMVDRALPDGGGRNVVNVILVDFRGWDTMGEITVLAVAAVGAVALARAGGRRPRVTAPPSAPANVETTA
jgi:multicomponent Na+:H+ antiporter subunit A